MRKTKERIQVTRAHILMYEDWPLEPSVIVAVLDGPQYQSAPCTMLHVRYSTGH